MKSVIVLMVATIALWGGCGPSRAEDIFFWTDENGIPHFTNVRPANPPEPPETRRELPHDAEAAARREQALREAAARRERERAEAALAEAVRRAEEAAREAERHAAEARDAPAPQSDEDDNDDRIRYRVPIGWYGHPPAYGRSHGHPVLGLNPLPPVEEESATPKRGRRRDRPNHPRVGHGRPARPCPRCPRP